MSQCVSRGGSGLIDLIQIAQWRQILREIALNKPCSRAGSPKPRHVPPADGAQRRRLAAEDADNKTEYGGCQGSVFAAGDHGDARREAVDAVEVEKIGGEEGLKGHERGGEKGVEDGEV